MNEKAKTAPKGRETPRRPPKTATAPPAPTEFPATPPQTGEATAASSWRSARRDGILVTLPSGQAARLRRTFNMLNALEAGQIPNPLAEHIRAAVDDAAGEDGVLDLKSLSTKSEEGQRSFVQFLELVMNSMPDIFVSPRVYLVPEGKVPREWDPATDPEVNDPEGLSVIDLDLQDQLFAFNFAQGGATALARFRPGQAEAAGAAQDGGGV